MGYRHGDEYNMWEALDNMRDDTKSSRDDRSSVKYDEEGDPIYDFDDDDDD